MGVFLPFLVVVNVIVCNGYLWRHDMPLEQVVEIHEKETVKKIYNTAMLKEILEFESRVVPDRFKKRYDFSYIGGDNCGKEGTAETIYINHIGMPDVIVLGDNGTFSADVTVNKVRKTATLLSVVIQKVGLPFDLPCTNNVGTCNYTNPCDILEKIDCPKEIVSQGWNCRCPIPVKKYSFGPITGLVPTVPLPAFLVDGTYNAKVQLFDGTDELLCYKISVAVKEK